MRKVFLSMMSLQKAEKVPYLSEDYDLQEKEFYFPMSYIIYNNIEENDKIVVVTGVERDELIASDTPVMINYKKYVEEITEIAAEKSAEVEFVELRADKNFGNLTFNRFFKEVTNVIKDEDRLFADITFGMKPFCLSMFVALGYVVKACNNVVLDTVIYAQRFTGSESAEKSNKSRIYDMTSLYFLNDISAKAQPGDKQALDTMLNFIMTEEF